MTTRLMNRTRPNSWKALLLPREHGSWSLALEPLGLGLIAAPSWAGALLAIGACSLFFARRPFQGTRTGDRRAWLALSALTVIALGTLAWGVHAATGPAGWALAAALPAGAAFAWLDRRKAGRETAAELSGATFFAVFAAAIALAAGRDEPIAMALAGFALARSATSILAIRAFLRRRRGESISRAPAVLATAVSSVAFGVFGAITNRWLPLAWTVVFALRAAWLLGPSAPAWTARRLGMVEALLGVLVMITSGVAFR